MKEKTKRQGTYTLADHVVLSVAGIILSREGPRRFGARGHLFLWGARGGGCFCRGPLLEPWFLHFDILVVIKPGPLSRRLCGGGGGGGGCCCCCCCVLSFQIILGLRKCGDLVLSYFVGFGLCLLFVVCGVFGGRGENQAMGCLQIRRDQVKKDLGMQTWSWSLSVSSCWFLALSSCLSPSALAAICATCSSWCLRA